MVDGTLITECKEIWLEFVGHDIFEESKSLFDLDMDSIRVVELGLAMGKKLGCTISWADLNVSTSFTQFVANIDDTNRIR